MCSQNSSPPRCFHGHIHLGNSAHHNYLSEIRNPGHIWNALGNPTIQRNLCLNHHFPNLFYHWTLGLHISYQFPRKHVEKHSKREKKMKGEGEGIQKGNMGNIFFFTTRTHTVTPFWELETGILLEEPIFKMCPFFELMQLHTRLCQWCRLDFGPHMYPLAKHLCAGYNLHHCAWTPYLTLYQSVTHSLSFPSPETWRLREPIPLTP